MSITDVSHEEQARPLSEDDLAAIAKAQEVLKAHGYAILKPFAPQDDYSAGRAPSVEPGELKTLMVLDFEATGKDPNEAIPIEIGFVMVEYDPEAGTIHRVLDRYSELEDPGEPLTPEIVELTGITDDDLKGKRFDDDRVNAAISKADLLIAHNASYDRVLGERRFSNLAKKAWACSFQEGPWDEMGIGSKKQEYLAFKVAKLHYGAHRAMADCEVLLNILSSEGPNGKTCFATVLENARKLTYTVWAEGSPFDAKDILKKEGDYRWSGDDPNKIAKTWYKDRLTEEGLQQQLDFLFERVYRRPVGIRVDAMNAMDRYSSRHTERTRRELSKPRQDVQADGTAQEPKASAPRGNPDGAGDNASQGVRKGFRLR